MSCTDMATSGGSSWRRCGWRTCGPVGVGVPGLGPASGSGLLGDDEGVAEAAVGDGPAGEVGVVGDGGRSTPAASSWAGETMASRRRRASIWSIMAVRAWSWFSVWVVVRPASASSVTYSLTGRASAMQATQAASVVSSSGSPCSPRVTSVMPTRPPGRRVRANSAAAAGLSGKVHQAHSQTSASKAASGSGSCSASPTCRRTRSARPAWSTAARARATVCSDRSTPSTVTPYSSASSRAVAPGPLATSSTRCPGDNASAPASRRVRASPPGW